MFKLPKFVFIFIWVIFLSVLFLVWKGLIDIPGNKMDDKITFVFIGIALGGLWVGYSFGWIQSRTWGKTAVTTSNILILILSIMSTLIGVLILIGLTAIAAGGDVGLMAVVLIFPLIVGIIFFVVGIINTLKYVKKIRSESAIQKNGSN